MTKKLAALVLLIVLAVTAAFAQVPFLGGLPVFDAGLVVAGTVGDVHLTTDDRLDLVRLHRVVELDRAEHVAVVGDGAGRHTQLSDLGREFFGPAGAVEQGVFGVKMEMSEGHSGSRAATTPPAASLTAGSLLLAQALVQVNPVSTIGRLFQ